MIKTEQNSSNLCRNFHVIDLQFLHKKSRIKSRKVDLSISPKWIHVKKLRAAHFQLKLHELPIKQTILLYLPHPNHKVAAVKLLKLSSIIFCSIHSSFLVLPFVLCTGEINPSTEMSRVMMNMTRHKQKTKRKKNTKEKSVWCYINTYALSIIHSNRQKPENLSKKKYRRKKHLFEVQLIIATIFLYSFRTLFVGLYQAENMKWKERICNHLPSYKIPWKNKNRIFLIYFFI